MNSRIRLADKSDLASIIELLNKVTLDLHQKGINQWEYPWNSTHIDADMKNGNIYVLTVDNSLVGTFSLKGIDTDNEVPVFEPGNLYLYRIAILPKYRGKNLGHEIIDYACKASRALDKDLFLDCWAGNHKLRNFYSKAGFCFCGDFPEEDYMISVFRYSTISS